MAKSILKQLKDDEREVRRKLIITAAKTLYKKKSFHSIGMRDISGEAGISVASLYQYFPSQDDLFVAILKTDLDEIKSQLWKDRQSLEDISINIVDFLIDNEDIFLMMSHFMVRGEKKPDSLEKFNEIQDIFLGMLEQSLAKSVPKVNFWFYSRAFFTALFGNVITFRNYSHAGNASQREILYHIVNITARTFQEAMKNQDYLTLLKNDENYFKLYEKEKSSC
ncbi:MAG: TetR/AcrR family transcriptional regulator [Proteobacteria bacterium]|nr:TetR/AcrR family transcriptional regulator [Pseudomonadota bacterium]